MKMSARSWSVGMESKGDGGLEGGGKKNDFFSKAASESVSNKERERAREREREREVKKHPITIFYSE